MPFGYIPHKILRKNVILNLEDTRQSKFDEGVYINKKRTYNMVRKMKILSVYISTPGEDAAWWRISNIVKMLRSAGHEVNVVHYVKRSSYEKLQNKERYEQDTFVMTSIPTVHLKHLKILRNGDYDLVYGNMQGGAFCSLLGKVTKTPLFFDMHDIADKFFYLDKLNIGFKYLRDLSDFAMGSFTQFLDLRFSDRVVCASHKMVEYLHSEKKIPLERIVYLPNGVDLEFFKPLNSERSRNMKQQLGLEDKIVFGYIGSNQKWQTINNFVEAAKRIDGDDIAFIVVGGEKKSKEGNLFFMPKVPRVYVRDYYSVCDVLVLPRLVHPTLQLSAPTKFAEYVAMGKPVLVTDVGDAADFVRKYKCGIVVENNKPESLVKGILEFKDSSTNERETMGKNSRKLAENEFDWNKNIDNLLKAIVEVA